MQSHARRQAAPGLLAPIHAKAARNTALREILLPARVACSAGSVLSRINLCAQHGTDMILLLTSAKHASRRMRVEAPARNSHFHSSALQPSARSHAASKSSADSRLSSVMSRTAFVGAPMCSKPMADGSSALPSAVRAGIVFSKLDSSRIRSSSLDANRNARADLASPGSFELAASLSVAKWRTQNMHAMTAGNSVD